MSEQASGNVSLYLLSRDVAQTLISIGLVGLGTTVLPNSIIPAGQAASFSLTNLATENIVVLVQLKCAPAFLHVYSCAPPQSMGAGRRFHPFCRVP